MYNVAVLRGPTLRPDPKGTWQVVCLTYSRPYALRVARKYRKLGFSTMVEEVQQEDVNT